MVIGVDFDNTIVCYDRLFHHVAVEKSLVPATVPADKESVRNYLREQDREDDWTELQGLVYGVRIREAEPFPGVREFFAECRRRGIPVYVVSHKTRLPVRGPQVDLHEAARGWLECQGFHDRRGGRAADRPRVLCGDKAGQTGTDPRPGVLALHRRLARVSPGAGLPCRSRADTL